MTRASSARAASSSRPVSGNWGRPSKERVWYGSRMANTMPTDSASNRRPTNPRTWLEAASSHWASSTRQSNGRSSAEAASNPEHGKSHQEPVGGRSRGEAKRDTDGVLLRVGQPVQPAEQRRAELMHRGKWQFHLRLDARDARDPNSGRLPSAVVQQGGLADARLAPDDQHRAPAVTDVGQ